MANKGKGRVPDIDPNGAGFPAGHKAKGPCGKGRGNNLPKAAPKKGK
ncbi:MAG: hypothetical protein IJP65_03455 [Bacteroidales bacterium]|nr:hypothetical protein [Bacteroidales bacterium]MBR0054344.1 hypothetical protein [Bacteroidales bacterium]